MHTSRSTFEPYSRNPLKLPQQAVELSRFAATNADWLKDGPYKGFLSRYGQGRLRAARNVARLTHREGSEFYAGIVRLKADHNKRPVAAGIGTIILNQGVKCEDQGYIGANVDYILDEAYDPDYVMHEMAAATILNYLDTLGNRIGEGVFATIEPGKLHQPEGFRSYLPKVGQGPVVLTIIPGFDTADPYDLTRNGRPQEFVGYVSNNTSPV